MVDTVDTHMVDVVDAVDVHTVDVEDTVDKVNIVDMVYAAVE